MISAESKQPFSVLLYKYNNNMSRKLCSLNVTDYSGIQIGSSPTKCILDASSVTGDRTITIPDVSDTLVCKNTTDALTNKTLNGTSNDIEANKIGQDSNAVTVSGAASAGQILKAISSSSASWQNNDGTYNSSNYLSLYTIRKFTYDESPVSIPFYNQVHVGSDFSHSNYSSIITINTSGTYLVSRTIKLLADRDKYSYSTFTVDTGSGYSTINYLTIYAYIKHNNYGTMSSTDIYTFNAGDKIKLKIVSSDDTNYFTGITLSMLKLF